MRVSVFYQKFITPSCVDSRLELDVDIDISHGTSKNLVPLPRDHDLSPINPTGPSLLVRPWETRGTPMSPANLIFLHNFPE